MTYDDDKLETAIRAGVMGSPGRPRTIQRLAWVMTGASRDTCLRICQNEGWTNTAGWAIRDMAIRNDRVSQVLSLYLHNLELDLLKLKCKSIRNDG